MQSTEESTTKIPSRQEDLREVPLAELGAMAQREPSFQSAI